MVAEGRGAGRGGLSGEYRWWSELWLYLIIRKIHSLNDKAPTFPFPCEEETH